MTSVQAHTFLYTGDAPDVEVATSDYPTPVTQSSGKIVPVVQAYAYTKYLGKLHLQFNDAGDLIEYDGTPILLNNDVEREEDVLALLEVYRPAILALQNEIVGVTKVLLDGSCRFNECNLGNFIADSMVDWRSLKHESAEGYWTDAPIALLQGGGIRTSVNHKSNNGNVTMEDAQTVLPFGSRMEIIEVTGTVLLEALEHSVYRYTEDEGRGEFLQVSGVQVVYDMNLETLHRVVEVKVLCSQCDVPQLETLDETKTYRVVVVDFLANGGDGYDMFVDKSIEKFEVDDIDVFVEYLTKKSPIHPAVEWRITIKPLIDTSEEVVGSTLVLLDNNCQQNECNLGNFITDSMVDWYALKYNDDSYWTDVSIAMIQGSRISASINPTTNGEDIKRSDAIALFQPSPLNLNIVSLTGSELTQMLEKAISNRADANNVEFLQVSGLQVEYDLNRSAGQRVTEVKALCTQCDVPELELLVLDQEYKVIMQSELAAGGDGFDEIIGSKLLDDLEETDLNVFIEYLTKKSPVHPAVEWRITIIEEETTDSTSEDSETSVVVTVDSSSTTHESTTQGASSLPISFILILLTSLVSLFVRN